MQHARKLHKLKVNYARIATKLHKKYESEHNMQENYASKKTKNAARSMQQTLAL